MPLNTLRLNHAPSSHPNDRIVFIKPLPRPASEQQDYQTADTFLRAIAAQCLPIMKSHHLSVTTLEEYEPNREFIGRNFNNGEIIQLVLRTKGGGWVSFNMVQMVMMHELAHNIHMNHGKGFWETRNKFSEEMKGLWSKGYTGEGFWGGGRCLGDLSRMLGNNVLLGAELGDLQVCGGTFRSRRRRKRTAGVKTEDGQRPELTWKEKRDRRIEKKFGKNGQTLGEDEDQRVMLEVSKKGAIGGKPRVAQSKRGRELRAAAALARFGTNKQEVDSLKIKEVEDGEDNSDDYEEAEVKGDDAKDVNGHRLLDSMGFGMIKVCDEEDGNDANVKQEMAELEGLDSGFSSTAHSGERPPTSNRMGQATSSSPADSSANTGATSNQRNPLYDIPQYRGSPSPPASMKKPPQIKIRALQSSQPPSAITQPAESPTFASHIVTEPKPQTKSPSTFHCPICTLTNDRLNPTCFACGHVLDTKKDSRHWRCASEACQESQYVNAGDAGVCGICGQRKNECREGKIIRAHGEKGASEGG